MSCCVCRQSPGLNSAAEPAHDDAHDDAAADDDNIKTCRIY